jgi:NADH dehydrogenase
MGDLKDRLSLGPACDKIDTVITTANSFLRLEPDNPQTVDLEGNRNLIDAAKSAGVNQFLFVSASVADPNSPVPFLQAKAKTEEYLRRSKMVYTIVAPNAFMDFWIANAVGIPAMKGQAVSFVGEGRRKHSFISTDDVAKITVASIGNSKAVNQRLVIGGPEPLSFLDAIAVYERLLGRKITVNHVAPMQPVPAFSEHPSGANLLPVFASFDMFDSPMDMTEIVRTFGIKLVSIEEFAKNMIAVS